MRFLFVMMRGDPKLQRPRQHVTFDAVSAALNAKADLELTTGDLDPDR